MTTNSPQTWAGYAPAFEPIIVSDTRAQDAAVAVAERPDPSQLWNSAFVSAAPYAAKPYEHETAFRERIAAAISANGSGQYWYILQRAGFWQRNVTGTLLTPS